jgi:hypothetical protein
MAGTVAPTTLLHRGKGIVRAEVAMTCDASGVLTAAVFGEFFGSIVNVFYDGGLDASAVITIADYRTGKSLIAYTTSTEGVPVSFRPSTVVADNAGTAITAGDGSGGAGTGNDVNRDIKVAGKLTLAVASGGVSETGKFVLVIDERTGPVMAITV